MSHNHFTLMSSVGAAAPKNIKTASNAALNGSEERHKTATVCLFVSAFKWIKNEVV
jgi:hypothetical protein